MKYLSLLFLRFQADTIKWEHRRHHNENIYNRLIKTGTLDNNTILTANGNFSSKTTNEKDIRDINELKRELGCNECKRLACVGNCTSAHDYHQNKRFIPFSSLSNPREHIPSKLNLRTQRSAICLRPRTTQQITTTRETKFKLEPTKLNLVVIVPSFQDESQLKRSQKKPTHGFLPGKFIRSQRRQTLAFI